LSPDFRHVSWPSDSSRCANKRHTQGRLEPSSFGPQSVRRSERAGASLALSAFAFPSEGAYDFLTGKNGADLFGRSDAQPVALQLEKSHLVLPREKLVPRYVDFGRKLFSVDLFPGVNKQ
jgi:hypothetical protein